VDVGSAWEEEGRRGSVETKSDFLNVSGSAPARAVAALALPPEFAFGGTKHFAHMLSLAVLVVCVHADSMLVGSKMCDMDAVTKGILLALGVH